MLKHTLVFLALPIAMASASALAATTTTLIATQNAQLDSYANSPVFVDSGVMSVFSNNYLSRDLLQFDLSSIPDNAIPLSAKLYLYHAAAAPGNGVISALRMQDDNWQQSTVTWSSYAPSFGNEAWLGESISQPYHGAGVWVLDVTKWNASADLADNKFTVMLRYSQGELDGSYRQSIFYTALTPNPNAGYAGDLRPYLEITYATAVPEPETWAMLLAGLGLVSLATRASLRSRSKQIF